MAPGRVNLIGEHTDYNGGLVMPTVIPQQTTVTIEPRSHDRVRLRSTAGLPDVESSVSSEPSRTHTWADYVLGVIWALAKRGIPTPGFEATVASTVPVGAGLSSSAALEVATLRALRAAFGLDLDDHDIARLAHEAESGFVGARVGLMDQMVCSLGRESEALLMDMRSLEVTRIPLAFAPFEIAVVDSGIRHDHATGGYNERRAECEEAARALGLASLRDAAPTSDLAGLPERLARRVRHVVGENARVEAARLALRRGDAKEFGRLISSSHVSLRDDFEVSLPEIDTLVASAQAQPNTLGARLTGGGFGGSVLIVTKPGQARAVADAAVRSAPAGATVILPAA